MRNSGADSKLTIDGKKSHFLEQPNVLRSRSTSVQYRRDSVQERKRPAGLNISERKESLEAERKRSSLERKRSSLERKPIESDPERPLSGSERRKSMAPDEQRVIAKPLTYNVLARRSTMIVTSTLFDPRFGDVWTEKTSNHFFRHICCPLHTKPQFTQEELEDRIHKLHKYCLIHLQDSYRVHLNRLRGIELLEEIIQRARVEHLSSLQSMSLIWCVLSCIHHFYIRLTVSNGFLTWSRRRQARRAMRTYEKLISLTLPHHFSTVMRGIMTFYSESKMWNTEYLCAELLKRLLYISQESESAVHAILDMAEKASVSNIREARQVIRVLYQVLENYPWQNMDEHLITRLLLMFKKSVMPEEEYFDYVPLRKGLEVCLRHIIENLPSADLLRIIKTMVRWTFDDNLTDEALLDFGNVLEYAAMMHETYLYRDSLYQDLFPQILNLVSSDNKLHSLLGNRVLQHMLDRHNNRGRFDTPRIYFDDIRFDIVVSQYNSEDKAFIRKFREAIHTTLLTSIQLHGIHRINLESTYTSVAILVVEIPCGYTAAAVVCLAMAIQEYALSDESMELECSHRLHATVMAIMSLVCWVHSAQVFYDYLKAVVTRRAQLAPHLNPPLRAQYEYAQHHILWNKPELFFEDWEARYGLWKCFRTRRARVVPATNIKATPSQTEIV